MTQKGKLVFWITFFAMSAAGVGAVNAIGSLVASDIGIALLTPVCVALFADAIMIGQLCGVTSPDVPASPDRTTWSTEHSRLLVEAYFPSIALVAAFILVKLLLRASTAPARSLRALRSCWVSGTSTRARCGSTPMAQRCPMS